MDYPEVQSVLEDRGFPEEVDGAGIAKRAERGIGERSGWDQIRE